MQKYLFIALVLVLPVFASAHVVVMPGEVGVGLRQIFNASVPNEKEIPTVGLRLVIPAGLESVTPNVKPGWKVDIKKEGEGEDAVVKEINWTGGSIPDGMRDDFFFRAMAPAEATTLQWKAYQTYSDGTVVAWDVNENDIPLNAEGEHESETMNPYSETKVVNDLIKEESPVVATPVDDNGGKDMRKNGRGCWGITGGMAAIALVLSAYAVYMLRCRPNTTLPQ